MKHFIGTSFNKIALALAAAAAVSISPLAHAGPDAGATKETPKEIAVIKTNKADEKEWSIEVGSGAQFSNIRSSRLDNYSLVPAFLTASFKVDDVSLDNVLGGVFRGYTEFLFQGSGYAITSGRESELLGANFGPRYNFVQPGWKVVPYAEGLVGFYFADSDQQIIPTSNSTIRHGLGQDFNFTFGVALGVRYDFNEDWFTRLGAVYTHVSNAGLSEPQFENRAIDAFGPEVSVGRRF